MTDITAQLLAGMGIDEKRELFEALRAATAVDLAGWDADERPTCCPRCNYTGTVRKGRNADGAQRWMCKACGATCCARTMSRFGQLKLPEPRSGPGSRGAWSPASPCASASRTAGSACALPGT